MNGTVVDSPLSGLIGTRDPPGQGNFDAMDDRLSYFSGIFLRRAEYLGGSKWLTPIGDKRRINSNEDNAESFRDSRHHFSTTFGAVVLLSHCPGREKESRPEEFTFRIVDSAAAPRFSWFTERQGGCDRSAERVARIKARANARRRIPPGSPPIYIYIYIYIYSKYVYIYTYRGNANPPTPVWQKERDQAA